MIRSIDRNKAADFIPSAIQAATDREAIFIKASDDELSWSVFKDQFSNEVWLTVISSSIFYGLMMAVFSFSTVEKEKVRPKYQSIFSIIQDILQRIWSVFMTTFGNGKICTCTKSQSGRVLTVAILLGGNFIF